MTNIVVVGVAGSGINFLKNIFLLSEKLRFDLPGTKPAPINNRYLFLLNYYKLLLENTQNSKDWLKHEWSLRMSSHWTDELDDNNCLIKVNNHSPTVFALHREKNVLVNDPLTIVSIEVDNKDLCTKLYRLKSKNDKFNHLSYNILSVPVPNRLYYNILFSDLIGSVDKIFELTESLNLGIDLHMIKSIHTLWTESNELLIAQNNL